MRITSADLFAHQAGCRGGCQDVGVRQGQLVFDLLAKLFGDLGDVAWRENVFGVEIDFAHLGDCFGAERLAGGCFLDDHAHVDADNRWPASNIDVGFGSGLDVAIGEGGFLCVQVTGSLVFEQKHKPIVLTYNGLICGPCGGLHRKQNGEAGKQQRQHVERAGVFHAHSVTCGVGAG